jgi:hypothetical protein
MTQKTKKTDPVCPWSDVINNINKRTSMKKTIKSAIAVTLFVAALAAAISASPNMHFSIQNNTSFNLGSVTIYNSSGTPTTIEVTGSGSYPVLIQGGVASAVIYGQLIAKNGQLINITLPYGPTGIMVQATLTGNQIVVTDDQIINSDKKPHSH